MDKHISREAVMDEYISREAVMNITAETGAWETQIRVRELPAANVKLVRHGRWVNCVDYKKVDDVIYYGYTSCSACGKMQQYGYKTKYCPNCGAKMNKEVEE